MPKFSKIFYINSINRISGETNNFLYKLQIPNEGYDRVTMLQCNIPASYYSVQDKYNTFILSELGVDKTITVTAGNYSATSFATIVTTLLNSNSMNGWIYNITIPSGFGNINTAKFTFTVSNNTGQPSFTFNLHINNQFGFNPNIKYTFVSNTLISQNVIKFIPEDTLFIHSDIVESSETSILQDIYNNNTVGFSNIIYQCHDVEGYSKKFKQNSSNTYFFSLTDSDNHPIDLNGLNLTFTILLYKDNSINDILKNYVKYSLLNG